MTTHFETDGINTTMSEGVLDICSKEFSFHTSKTFNELWEEKHFTDVTLVTEDDYQVTGHRVILASMSPFFKKKSLSQ